LKKRNQGRGNDAESNASEMNLKFKENPVESRWIDCNESDCPHPREKMCCFAWQSDLVNTKRVQIIISKDNTYNQYKGRAVIGTGWAQRPSHGD
jgi:hypothetical protein